MKEKNTPQYEMVDIYKSTIEKESEAVEKEYPDDIPEEELKSYAKTIKKEMGLLTDYIFEGD